MAAHFGNQWWKLAPKTGRKKKYETPEELEEDCMEYFERHGEIMYPEKQWVGKDAIPVTKEHPRPFTQESLCIFLGMNVKTWYDYGTADSHKEFHPVVSRVNNIIFSQQYELATTGFFNANIVAMKIGLRQKSEVDITTDRPDITSLFKIVDETNTGE